MAGSRATMDFFAAEEAARRHTFLLVIYFVLAVVGTAAAIWAGVSAILLASDPAAIHAIHPLRAGLYVHRAGLGGGLRPFGASLALVVSGLVTVVTGIGAAFHASRLSDGGPAVARMLGGVPVDRGTREPGERRLVNVAEEMAIASGLPPPALYVLPGEGGINAFAAGLSPDRAVVAVTRGALDRLSRDELQGVVAHEYSHILNGDARLNVRLLAVVGGITALAAIGRVFLSAWTGDDYSPRWRRRRGGGGAIVAIGIVLWVAGSVGAFFGRLIRAAVSRQREYLADAAAVQFTRNPDGLAGALAKIAEAGSRIQSPLAPEAAHLFFANGLSTEWFATHPPIKDRIDRIAPQGGYLRAMRLAQEGAVRELAPGEEGGAKEPAPSVEVAPAFLAAAPAMTTPVPVPVSAAAVMASVGRPEQRHVSHAAAVLSALPAEVSAAAREPSGAAALVRALLTDPDPGVRAVALGLLPDPKVRARTATLAATLAAAGRDARFPALGLALPALDALPPKDAASLVHDLAVLAAADGRISVFEWAVQRIVRRRLSRQLGGAPRPERLRTLHEVEVDLLDVFSALAWAGTREEASAQAALEAALVVLGLERAWRVLPREKLAAKRLDAALDRLDGAVPPLKARVVEACVATVTADGKVLPVEAELLRAIAASLGVPMPPILAHEPADAPAGAA